MGGIHEQTKGKFYRNAQWIFSEKSFVTKAI
jgi:hypothetical protein